MEKRTTENVPQQPLAKFLPPPVLLWQAEIVKPLGNCQARVVLHYVWTLPAGAKAWEALPAYTLETSETSHLMGELNWVKKPMTELPAEFFEAYMERISQGKGSIM